MALTEYPVSKFASGKSTYRAVATTIGASVARGRAISKLINDLVWFRSFRAKVVTRNELSQRSARESVRVSRKFQRNSLKARADRDAVLNDCA